MRWTTPAITISQATKILTATAASIGEPTARTPRQISNTPHKSDNVDACRTTPERFCAIKASSSDGGESTPMGSGNHPLKAGNARKKCFSSPRLGRGRLLQNNVRLDIRRGGRAKDPSLRVKNGSGRDDAVKCGCYPSARPLDYIAKICRCSVRCGHLAFVRRQDFESARIKLGDHAKNYLRSNSSHPDPSGVDPLPAGSNHQLVRSAVEGYQRRHGWRGQGRSG